MPKDQRRTGVILYLHGGGYTCLLYTSTGISASLYRLYAWASVNGQEDRFTRNDRKVLRIMQEAYQRRYQPYQGTCLLYTSRCV